MICSAFLWCWKNCTINLSRYTAGSSTISRILTLKENAEYKIRLRHELREFLNSLMRFEKYLKKVFVKLDLLDDSDVSIKIVQVPEASYSLFKEYVFDDVAPKFVADSTGTHYILRLATATGDRPLVNVNNLGHVSLDLDRLFKEGTLIYEMRDFDHLRDVKQVLHDSSAQLVQLRSVVNSVRTLIHANCDPRELI